jgi:fructan beta-fructosidase
MPMVAIYTAEIKNLGQRQNLAYSLDNGNAWTIYDKNPILDLHKKDFRDPFVAWYAPQTKWIMAVMLPIEHIVQLYDSKDLENWNLMSQFGPAGDTSAVWECPSLIEVPVTGHAGQKKWLLQMSQNASMQYFIGDFDGTTFNAEQNSNGGIQRPDYGPDYYAAIPYNNLPANSPPIAIGWINNWNYANDLPTTPWKGAMSIPRTLAVRKTLDGWELLQQPLPEIKTLRRQQLLKHGPADINQSYPLAISSTQCEINLNWQAGNSGQSGIRLASDGGHYVEIGYDAPRHMIYVDRTKSSDIHFHHAFDSLSHSETPLVTPTGNIKLRIFVDRSMVEVFVNDGQIAFTSVFFPSKTSKGMELFSLNGASKLNSLEVWSLGSVWP